MSKEIMKKYFVIEDSHLNRHWFGDTKEIAKFLNTKQTHMGKLRRLAKQYGYKTYFY